MMKNFHYSFLYLCKLKKNTIVSKIKNCSYFIPITATCRKLHISFVTARYYCMFVDSPRALLPKNGKYFKEIENEYAHGVMLNSPAYSSSLLKYPLQIKSLNYEQSSECRSPFNNFAKATRDNISIGLDLESPEFSVIIKELVAELPLFSDKEIEDTLRYLCMWPPTSSTVTPNFKALWNELDRQCVKRMKNWNVSRKLLIGDHWFRLRLSRISLYNRELIADLINNIEMLTNQQVIQLMFYINIQRKIPVSFVSRLEKKLESVINSVTIEEIGIICLAFFKTKSKITEPETIKSIIKYFISNIEHINTLTVASILKFLRKSLNSSLINSYIYVLHKCISYIDNMDVPTSVHLALLSSECDVYHPLLLNNVSDKLTKQMSQVRLKDCVKLLQCMAHFNHFPAETFHELFSAEIMKNEREDEVNTYPRDIIYSSLFYAYMGHYNYDILAKMFEKQFIEMSYLRYPYILHCFAEIDYCIEIECPDYTGPKLDIMKRKILHGRRGNMPNKSDSNMQTRLLGSVYECLIEILGNNENVLIRHILPHVYSPDIIVRLFSKNKETLSGFCNNIPSDVILKPPIGEVWTCFVVCNNFCFAYKSKQITGVTAMKLRQLKKIGYHVIFIPYYDLPLNWTHRKNYLKEKLNSLEQKYYSQQLTD